MITSDSYDFTFMGCGCVGIEVMGEKGSWHRVCVVVVRGVGRNFARGGRFKC